ncbi:MAG: DNA internalization-related competence protein ComEC/Rec2 [Ignavibacteriae bacterium]|nr:MAG: DNA internalization-related competence protein ComEC/Rec2 [Ignavibacteriota bacterium]
MQIFEFKKYPALFAVIPLIAGILVSYIIEAKIPFTASLSALLLQSILFIAIIYFISKTSYINTRYYFILFITIFLFGFIRFQFFYNNFDESSIVNYIEDSKDTEVKVYGKLIEHPDIDEGRIKLLIETDSIKYFNKVISVNCNLTASIYKNKFKEFPPQKIGYGDLIELKGNVQKLPHKRNPGEFDYGQYLKLHGIDAMFTSYGFENIKLIEHNEHSFIKQHILFPVKEYSIKTIDSLIGGEEGEFLKGLVLGERSNISKEIKQDFVNAGVSHIIAVSGLNVAYLTIVLMLILQLFPIKYIYKIIIVFLFLIFYMNLTGNVPSIVRATVMASIFLLSQILERKTNSFNVISVAAIIILIIDPRQLFDAGFILSFWAIISIVLIYPKLHKIASGMKFYQKIGNDPYKGRIIKGVIALFLGTLAAQIGTLPITALMFKKISIVSLITNLFAIPLSNAALGLGFALIIFSLFYTPLAVLTANVTMFILHYLLVSFNYFSNFSFSFLETYSIDYLFLVLFYIAVIVLFFIPQMKTAARLIIVVLLILNYFVINDLIHSTDKVRFAYLDVGNSGTCLISTPGNKNVLIGCGASSVKYTSAERNIIPYLKLQGINKIDVLLITSLSKNEFRNLEFLVKNFQVSRIYIPSYYRSVFNAEHKIFKDCEMKFIENSFVIKNDMMRLFVFHEPAVTTGKSMFVNVQYGNESFIFSDAVEVYDDNYYQTITPRDVTILKAPGAGSFNNISAESLLMTNPKYIVISSLDKKKKRLNSDIFVSSLRSLGYNVIETGDKGAIIFDTDGERTEIVDW